MRAGLLTEKVKILKNVVTKDKFGYEKTTQAIRYVTRARVELKSGNRANENGEIVYSNFNTMTVRIYVPVENTDIIEWDNKKYRILYISPDKATQSKKIDVELINE